MKKMIAGMLFLAGSSALAALPPYYQSAREMTAILESKEIASEVAAGQSIDSLTRTKDGYVIVAGKCSAVVEVVYGDSEGRVGPIPFELKINEASCVPR